MANDSGGLYAPAFNQINDGELKSGTDSLRVQGLSEESCLLGLVEFLQDRPLRSIWKALKDGITALQALPEMRTFLDKLSTHGKPLSTLTGKNETQLGNRVFSNSPWSSRTRSGK